VHELVNVVTDHVDARYKHEEKSPFSGTKCRLSYQTMLISVLTVSNDRLAFYSEFFIILLRKVVPSCNIQCLYARSL